MHSSILPIFSDSHQNGEFQSQVRDLIRENVHDPGPPFDFSTDLF